MEHIWLARDASDWYPHKDMSLHVLVWPCNCCYLGKFSLCGYHRLMFVSLQISFMLVLGNTDESSKVKQGQAKTPPRHIQGQIPCPCLTLLDLGRPRFSQKMIVKKLLSKFVREKCVLAWPCGCPCVSLWGPHKDTHKVKLFVVQ